MISSLCRRLAVLALSLSLGACATYDRTKPAPVVAGPIAINVKSEQLSAMNDLPIGAYKIPDSDVVVSGHQRGNGGALLFGLLGVAVVHAANSNSSAAGVSNTEQILRLKLADQTRVAIEAEIAQQSLSGSLAIGTGATQLDVTSALLLSYVNDTQSRPFAILKVALTGADKRPIWETRYLATTGEVRALEGPDSWTADGGAPLKAALATSLQRAVKVLLTDVVKPYARDEKEMTTVEGGFPYLRQRLQLKGYRLVEDEKYIAFVPKIGDVMVFAGVNVLDRSTTVYRPAKPDDEVLKMLPDLPAAESKPTASLAPAGAVQK